MRLWLIICALFLIYSIFRLFQERTDFNFYEIENNNNEIVQYSACLELNELFKNETDISLNMIKIYLYSYFKELNYTDKFPNFYDKNDFNKDKEIIINQINLNEIYVYQKFVCVIINSFKQNPFFLILNPKYFVINKRSYQFTKLKSATVNQLIIKNKLNPNCAIKLNRFKCINNCVKKFKLSKYYYDPYNDNNELIKLKYDDNDKEIKDNENKCISFCDRINVNCKLILFIPKYYEIKELLDKKSDNEIKPITTILEAKLVIGEFDFYLQLIGLVCFFLDLCFYRLLAKLIKLKIKKSFKFKNLKIEKNTIKKYLKLAILLFFLIYTLISYFHMIINYLNKRDYPIMTIFTTTLLKPEPIDLIICFYISFSYKDKTLLQLENNTSDQFNKSVHDIYIEYQNNRIKTDWILMESKIIFKRNINQQPIKDQNKLNLTRCYVLKIKPNEFKYQSLLSISKLVVEFKITNKEYELFLSPPNQIFNSKSYQNLPKYIYIKKVIKRSRLNKRKKCIYYNENQLCDSKLSCIDQCINRQFINDNKNISIFNLIIKDHFTDQEWSQSYLNYSFNLFNQTKIKCEDKLSNKYYCNEINYIRFSEIADQNYVNKQKLELYYDIIKEIEEQPSIYKLLMDILNIQSILFGLNFFNIIKILFDLKIKISKLLIYLICLIGFSYHLWFIFDEIINGELIYSQYYKLEEKLNMPDLIFCVKYNQLIDYNHKFNFDYLEKISKNINSNNIFKEIFYLNQFNNWIKFNNSNIDTFYFLNKKCFEIKFNLEYKLDQFTFKFNDKHVIKILFNISSMNANEKHYFLTKISAMEFSKQIKFDLKYPLLIEEERFEIDYDDKFNLIKNPLSLIYGQNDLNNADKYLINLINNLKIKYQLCSLNLPLYNGKFINNLIIDNFQIFDQYYLQVQNVIDQNIPSNLNYKKTLINHKLNRHSKGKNLLIDLIFFKKIIKITNEDNYTKLIVNLLNLFSLWFDLSLFDLQIYLDLFLIKINFIFVKFYKFLLNNKMLLCIKIFKD